MSENWRHLNRSNAIEEKEHFIKYSFFSSVVIKRDSEQKLLEMSTIFE